MKSSVHIGASLRPRYNNNKKFKGLTKISSKDSLVANKTRFKILCVQKSIIANFMDSSNMGFHLAGELYLPKAHKMAPFHLVNVPQ